MKLNKKEWIKITIALVIAFVSIFMVSKTLTSVEFYAETIASLDAKQDTVMALTAASTAASTAITLIPGDGATPIANELADLSTYFLLITTAIFLEKYLVTIMGYATCYFLVPGACLTYVVGILTKKKLWKVIAGKLFVFGMVVSLIIPTSVKITNIIEATYESSINETLEVATQTTQTIEDASAKEQKGLLGLFSGIKDGITTTINKAETMLSNFIESVAVMIVTSCVIPILVIIFFLWISKIIFEIPIPIQEQKYFMLENPKQIEVKEE